MIIYYYKKYLLPHGRLFGLLLTLFCVQLALGQSPAKDKPNIVLIIADDIGWADIGLYGNKDVKTPNIDALGKAGLLFKNMYVTTSSCSPSRNSIITGRYPHNTGAPELHEPLPNDQFIFPEKLKDAGYYTALSGKNHMGGTVKKAFNRLSAGEGPGGEEDWVRILQDRPKHKPFFLWLAAHDAHRDWQIDDKGVIYDPDQLSVPPMLYDGAETRKDLANYYHEVSRLDYYVGRVVDELKRQGVLENTYIIFMSDNGSPFPRNKVRLYDSGVKSPFIVRGPGVQNAQTEALLMAIDIAPTVLEIVGLHKHQRIQGVSFNALLKGKSQAIRDFVFTEHNWHVFQGYERMVRSGSWVYIRNGFPERRVMATESSKLFPAGKELWEKHDQGLTQATQEDVFLVPRPSEELFNVTEDPFQFTNVATAEKNKKILDYLRVALDTWILETGDSKPKNPTPDRDDIDGNKLPGKWGRGEKPGDIHHASQINLPGPILQKDVKMEKPVDL
ncbi:sulfatase family protein [Sphingobacterium paludis]|uniref:Arylsulfatase A-like enzyme n=1 Tax=Sphingobacterium paludis TaxID=1476465 RepID=A0A4R7CT83_9SPHI|nr:sulfatase [Sphingobacterium paludis]TDS09806.1 arylsulfatase A-like enzyme [Sphingobacterium paludis]